MDSDELLTSSDPAVSYRAHRRLAGDPDGDPEQQRRRQQVAGSENVRRMLSGRRSDGTIGYGDVHRERELAAAGRAAGAYRKWQGPHWTLAGLAELGYPPGDASLRPVAGAGPGLVVRAAAPRAALHARVPGPGGSGAAVCLDGGPCPVVPARARPG